jgi:hypothetical protein
MDGCAGPGYAKASPGTQCQAGEALAKTASPRMTLQCLRAPDAAQRAASLRRGALQSRGPGNYAFAAFNPEGTDETAMNC